MRDYDLLTKRRAFLRNAFVASAGAAGSVALSGCTSPDQTPGFIPTDGEDDDGDVKADTCDPITGNGQELNIPLGRISKYLSVNGDAENATPDAATQIQIPPGFSIRQIAQARLPVMTDATIPTSTGYNWHELCDGGACYDIADDGDFPGGWVYTSNSEFLGAPQGGAGAVKFDADGNLVDAYRILTDTQQNCGGGYSPWNTWFSGEETGTGQMWECDPYQESQGIARPMLGRFAHEACAIDDNANPVTGNVHDGRKIYLTEDSGSGRFYRWSPLTLEEEAADTDGSLLEQRWPAGGAPTFATRGRLEVLNLEGFGNNCYPDTASVKNLLRAFWAPALEPFDTAGQSNLRSAAADADATVPGTVFQGGEGIWYYKYDTSKPVDGDSNPVDSYAHPTSGIIFFTTKGDNRVWALDIDNQVVEIIFDNSQIAEGMADVDNLCNSPWGDIVVAEDLVGARVNIRIIIVVPNETPYQIVVAQHPGSEICGPALTSKGHKLYFSSQRQNGGTTYEVTLPDTLWDDTKWAAFEAEHFPA